MSGNRRFLSAPLLGTWYLNVKIRSLQQNGATFGEATMVPPTPTEQYPEYPEQVDDAYIYPTHIGEQPEGILPLVTGFTAGCEIYRSYQELSTMELAYGIGEVIDWEKQKRVLNKCLKQCKAVLDTLAGELKVWPVGGQFGGSSSGIYPLSDELGLQTQLSNHFELDNHPEERRKVQYEIQKANIYASHLSTRSYIVEKYFALSEAYNKLKAQEGLQDPPDMASAGLDMLGGAVKSSASYDSTDREMSEEREQIIKDLLIVLGSINQVSMEPNGDSLVSFCFPTRSAGSTALEELVVLTAYSIQTVKIRQIASTLLDVPKTRKSSLALQAEQYLIRFLDILSKLERSSLNTVKYNEQDDEQELRHWADLREHQLKFQQAGGVFGLI